MRKQVRLIAALLALFVVALIRTEAHSQEPIDQKSFEGRNIVALGFRGSTHFSPDSFFNLMKVKSGDRYQGERLEVDLDRLRVLLFTENGYIKARFGTPTIQGTAEGLKIIIPVEEGLLYRFGVIRVEDSTVFPTEKIIEMVGLKSGEVVKGSSFHKGLDQLRKEYAKRGYVRFDAGVALDYKSAEPDAGEGIVDVTLSMEEGNTYFIRRVEFSGNHTTKDNLVRRRARLREGEIFNGEDLHAAIKRLNRWGRFEELALEDYEIHIDERERAVDILIKLKERGQ